MSFILLNNTEINRQKWDACVAASHSAVAYASAWYLDCVSPNWLGIIIDDYRMVMPLPAKRKFLLPVLLQPYYCQQLGFFGSGKVAENDIKDIASLLKRRFVYCNFQVNANSKGLESFFNYSNRVNHELNLNKSVDDLRKGFSTNTKRNIAKAQKNNLAIRTGISATDFMQLKEERFKGEVASGILAVLSKIVHQAQVYNKLEVVGVYDDLQQLHAIVVFIKEYNRFIYLNAFSTEIGKESKAMFFLVNDFIVRHAQTDVLIDFEGSDIESVARFYTGFGALPVWYKQLTYKLFG